jgi:hypothetical protein
VEFVETMNLLVTSDRLSQLQLNETTDQSVTEEQADKE